MQGTQTTRGQGAQGVQWQGAFAPVSVHMLPPAWGGHAVCMMQFDASLFTAATPALHGLVLPPSIRASVPKRQAEFAAGRLCAQAALQAYGHEDAEIGIGMRREPLWPEGMAGSISHSTSFAAAVVVPARTPACGIGIDIESRLAGEAREAVERSSFSAAELALLRAAGGRFDALLTAAFSAKESFFKAAYGQVQAYFDFDAVEVAELCARTGTLKLRGTRALAPQLREGQCYRVHVEWIVADTVFTAVVLPSPHSQPGKE
jgi:enterobactin synthetase component D